MHVMYNGDSNMDGSEIGIENSISSLLSEKLHAGTSINLSMCGCSNDRIYDTTMNYLQHVTPDFVVIGWTEPHRIQFYDATTYKFIELNEYEIRNENLTTNQQAHNDQIQDLMSSLSVYAYGQSLYWHNKIYNMHSYLNSRKIPHLFFNAIRLFYEEIVTEKYHFNWDNCYYQPYTENMREWGVKNNYTQITPGAYHFDRVAQEDYTEKLWNHIELHGLNIFEDRYTS